MVHVTAATDATISNPVLAIGRPLRQRLLPLLLASALFGTAHAASPTLNLDAYKGKVVYVDFWASWCGPCRQSFPWMNDLQAKYGSRGLQIVGVNLDAKDADARKFLSENNGNFLLAFDNKGATPKLYGVKGMPTSYLIDREGRIVSEHTGFNFSKTAGLEKEIEKLLENK